ncbi:MAG: hypothetical protein ABJD68_08840 [Nakamurella sp.]
MKKAAVRALTTNAAVAQGVELAGQVSASAAELLRTRREPAVIARKKRKAARRRVRSWSAGGVVGAAVTTAGVVSVVSNGVTVGIAAILVVAIAALIWCIVGLIGAVKDLRARDRIIAALPPPAPSRSAVASRIRPAMARLDGYSDGLRQLVEMVGLVRDDPAMRRLRDEILSAADVSEGRLRQQARDLSGLIKARKMSPTASAAQLDETISELNQEISAGVAGYGELVSAATEAVAASRQLAAGTPGTALVPQRAQDVGNSMHPELAAPIDQLRSLAAGMRELAGAGDRGNES